MIRVGASDQCGRRWSYLKSIMYLDFPTLPSCKTVCLPFSCPIKVVYLVSAAILIFHFGVTVMCSSDSQLGMKCYLQGHLEVLHWGLNLVPHPSCPLPEVQFISLCHLLWTRNISSAHSYLRRSGSRLFLKSLHQTSCWKNAYMVVERGSWA